MEFRRVGEIACCLRPTQGSVIHYHTSVEVSFDCSNCKRTGRTVRFDNMHATGVCAPQKCDGFPGRLFSVLSFELDGKSIVKYQIHYTYSPFLDLKNGNESTCEPTWGRVSFDITCAKCGSSTRHSTQNNLVRPYPVYCACGGHLYDDTEEMPLLRAYMGDPMKVGVP
jgi:hypothetical protein